MKSVIVHWVEMRTLEVPDECPTDNVDEFEQYLFDRDQNDPYAVKSGDTFAVKANTRDFELVEVTQMSEDKCGVREDKYER